MKTKHVIIGSSAAGLTAAKTIRIEKPDDEILVISADEFVYSRCMLHKYISGDRNLSSLSFVEDDFFEKYKIDTLLGRRVSAIDPSQKKIFFYDEEETYDKLLIATGTISSYPPIVGLTGVNNILGLRDIADANNIRAYARIARHICIIGAGLVGLDAASGLTGMKKDVTVIETFGTILPNTLDQYAAKTYQDKFEEFGCKFRFNSKAVEAKSDDLNNVSSVVLESGEELRCDLLIVAIGVTPAVKFLENSGIDAPYGVTVNEFMETNVADVYAAGDITGMAEAWPDALKQGEAAALNMVGIRQEYIQSPIPQNAIHFFGIPTLSVGQVKETENDVAYAQEDAHNYRKVVLNNNIPVGVLLQGDISRAGFWQYAIKNKIEIESEGKNLWSNSFADAYGITESGEYVWIVK